MDTVEKIIGAKPELVKAAAKIAEIAAKVEDAQAREYLLNFMSCQSHDLAGAVKRLESELLDKAKAADDLQQQKAKALHDLAGALGVAPEELLKGRKDVAVQLEGIAIKADQGKTA